MSEFVIETQHLYKRFGQVTALEDINIQIRQGEFIAIMGASGSGKTTLMNILTGLDTASEGKVILDGVDAAQLDEVGRQRFRAEKIGLVFQQFHLIPYLTALENVMLAQHSNKWDWVIVLITVQANFLEANNNGYVLLVRW